MFNASNSKQLFDAAKNNDLKTVKFFIEEQNAPVTIMNNVRRSLAHVAAKNGSLDVVQYVVEKIPSILSKTDKYDFTVLRLAIRAGAFDVVRYLVEKHEADMTKRNDRDLKNEAMHTAIKYGHLNILKYFIEEKNFDPNTPGEWDGQPLIFSAVKYQQQDIINYLVREKNVDMERLNFRKENLLYVTVRTDDLSYMRYLLEQKGVPYDINWKNVYGETLVFTAATLNRTTILKYLVGERYADVNIACDGDELTPLHCAAIQNHFEICEYLIEHEAKPDVKDRAGEIAAQKTRNRELRSYLQKNANVTVSTKRTRRHAINLGYFTVPYEYTGISEQIDAGTPMSTGGLTEFLNFFVIATLVLLKNTRYSPAKRNAFSSPRSILLNRAVDPIAVDAVKSVPEFRI